MWGRKERKRNTERKRQVLACLFRRAMGKESRVDGAYLLKGPFTAEYICSDIAAIGPQADQGTAWVSPAR